jgi:hypothetical protein
MTIDMNSASSRESSKVEKSGVTNASKIKLNKILQIKHDVSKVLGWW